MPLNGDPHFDKVLLFLFFQILEAADKIQALDMKKHALRLMVHNFQNVSLRIMVSGIMCLYFDTFIYTLNTLIQVYLVKF